MIIIAAIPAIVEMLAAAGVITMGALVAGCPPAEESEGTTSRQRPAEPSDHYVGPDDSVQRRREQNYLWSDFIKR